MHSTPTFNRPFPRKIPLGISVGMATTFLVFHALQAWMAPFKFEVNWMFNGVDMTSQTYTHQGASSAYLI